MSRGTLVPNPRHYEKTVRQACCHGCSEPNDEWQPKNGKPREVTIPRALLPFLRRDGGEADRAQPEEVAGRGAASDDEPVKVEPPRTACPECSGRLKLIAFIAIEAVARRILDHLGLDATGPPLARARVPDELVEPVPDHDAVDPIYLD